MANKKVKIIPPQQKLMDRLVESGYQRIRYEDGRVRAEVDADGYTTEQKKLYRLIWGEEWPEVRTDVNLEFRSRSC